LLVFLIVFGVHASSPVYQSSDSRWTLYLAASIVQEHDLDLDEYREVIPFGDYRTRYIDGRVLTYFPIGVPLLAVPFAWLHRATESVGGLGFGAFSPEFEATVASFFVAVCVVLFYLICRRSLDVPRSLFLAFVFAFATSAWSTASRALWQHGPSMLMLCTTLYLALLAEDRPWLIQFAGLPLAYSFVIRPTNSISVLLFSVFLFTKYRKYVPGYLGLSMVIAAPFLLFNLVRYHSFFPPYYAPGRIGSSARFFQAVAGNVISPARGLFIYSPVLLLSVYGVALKARNGQLTKLDVTLICATIFHVLAVSSLPLWWGGHSFGPRFLTDMLPYWMYLTIPAVGAATQPTTARDWICAATIGLLTAYSVMVHYRGATDRATYDWNSEPVNVDEYPERLWDWGDLQYLRGFPAFDSRVAPLIAPRITAEREQVFVLCRSGAKCTRQVGLRFVNVRNNECHWEAEIPTGVVGLSTGSLDAVRFSLDVQIPEDIYPLGRHHLGEIKVVARAPGRLGGKGDSVSVPVQLYVVDELHTFFFPIVSR
jgi:hypothetical protein